MAFKVCGVTITPEKHKRPVFQNDVFEARQRGFGSGIVKAFEENVLNLDDPNRFGFVPVVISVLKNWNHYAPGKDEDTREAFIAWCHGKLDRYPGKSEGFGRGRATHG